MPIRVQYDTLNRANKLLNLRPDSLKRRRKFAQGPGGLAKVAAFTQFFDHGSEISYLGATHVRRRSLDGVDREHGRLGVGIAQRGGQSVKLRGHGVDEHRGELSRQLAI